MLIDIDPAGFVHCQGHTWRCALGRGGVHTDKREGDGVTPAGVWALGRVFYRADRLDAPETGLDVVITQPDWGWCDDAKDAHYNRLITLPHPARHEMLWREDSVYDVVVDILYNAEPVQAGRGSAIFLHVAKPGYPPTEGCIALALPDLLQLLALCHKGDGVAIAAPD